MNNKIEQIIKKFPSNLQKDLEELVIAILEEKNKVVTNSKDNKNIKK